jgi:DNA-binding PadR family transcriptional regulator
MTLKSPTLPGHLQPLLPLTPAVFFILFSLAEGEKHGYAIMQSVSTLSAETLHMGPGTLYTTLQRLLELSLIEETSGPAAAASNHESRRRYYRLTSDGRLILEAEVSRMESVVRLARKKRLVPQTTE